MDDDIVDITSRENAGTGSVNMRRFYFLVGPKKPHNAESFRYCHIVEVKQQRKAAPLFYFDNVCPVNRLNPAHLTARSQRRMQRRPDLLLDEVIWDNAHWLIRSRHHAKVGLDPHDIGMGNKAAGSMGGMIDQITAAYSMSTFFLIFTFVPIIAGFVLIGLSPIMKKLMHGIK